MGQLYSHLVFRPPPVCTYQSTNGRIRYVMPNEDGLPTIYSTELIWLLNKLQFRIPCAMLRRPNAEYVALYAHQNAEDLGTSIRDAHLLSVGLGIDVLTFEYSGYGLSEKPSKAYPSSRLVDGHTVAPSFKDADRRRAEPSEKACCSDIIAAYTYLTDQCDIHPSKIIVFGRSIGSGPAVYCATSRRVGGLVLISPIASAVRVPLKRLNITLPFIDTFPNIDRASKIKCPVLVVHGDMDELVPKLHAQKLFEKIKHKGNAVSPLWIPTAQHNNVVEDFHSVVFDRYLTFLDELKAMRGDKKSIDGRPISRDYRRQQFPDVQRPVVAKRRRHPLACLYPSRMSLDNFSVSAKAGDFGPGRPQSRFFKRPLGGLLPLGCLNGVENRTVSIDSEASPSSLMMTSQNGNHMYQRHGGNDVANHQVTTQGRSLKFDQNQLEIQTMSWDLFRMSLERFERSRPMQRRGLNGSIERVNSKTDFRLSKLL